jgi:probable rRNA maturation factor
MVDGDSGPRPTEADSGNSVVAVFDRQQEIAVDEGRLAELMHRVVVEEGVATPWEAALTFVDSDQMAALNAEHRGIDQPTDVLAFGADDGSAPRGSDEPRLVGDVVICPSVAAANAEAQGNSVGDEIALLVVHGTLHLLGYDHIDDVDADKMEGREQELLAQALAMTARAGARAGSR